jgi:hypothetical protein
MTRWSRRDTAETRRRLTACWLRVWKKGPKHSTSTSFRGVPKHQSSTPQERSRSTSVQKGVEPKKVCMSFLHRSSIQHKYPTLQRRYLVMSDLVRFISMHCSLSGCAHSKTPSSLLFQKHQWAVIKKSWCLGVLCKRHMRISPIALDVTLTEIWMQTFLQLFEGGSFNSFLVFEIEMKWCDAQVGISKALRSLIWARSPGVTFVTRKISHEWDERTVLV